MSPTTCRATCKRSTHGPVLSLSQWIVTEDKTSASARHSVVAAGFALCVASSASASLITPAPKARTASLSPGGSLERTWGVRSVVCQLLLGALWHGAPLYLGGRWRFLARRLLLGAPRRIVACLSLLGAQVAVRNSAAARSAESENSFVCTHSTEIVFGQIFGN